MQFFIKSSCFGRFEDNTMELFHEKVHDFVDLMTVSSNFFIKMFMFRLFWGQWYATFSWKSSRFRWFEDNYHIASSWNCLRFGRFEGNIMWFFLKKSIIKLFRALLVCLSIQFEDNNILNPICQTKSNLNFANLPIRTSRKNNIILSDRTFWIQFEHNIVLFFNDVYKCTVFLYIFRYFTKKTIFRSRSHSIAWGHF